jgi:transcriptional regulator with XRE-family HTH domain
VSTRNATSNSTAKLPSLVDKHVGGRVRVRRLMLGLSQESLGEYLGLTFQQVQKYEKGVNRISASRLQQLSEILEVPVPFFFEGAPPSPGAPRQSGAAPAPTFINEFLTNADGHALVRAFVQIQDVPLRRAIVRMVEAIVAAEGAVPAANT